MAAWLTTAGIITYRGVSRKPRTTPLPMPLPSEYASSFVIYGALSLFPADAAPFTSAVGWGLVVAMLLGLWNPTASKAGKPTVNTPAQTAKQLATVQKG